MAFVYIVRCNFTEPAKERAWNAWYSGPKIAQMLAKPHFRSCQRFERMSGIGRNYLALWTLGSPDAFKTEQYTTDWGFFEWAPHITDWSRDLFDAGDATEADFAVPPQAALDLVSFDGMSRDETHDARDAIAAAQPDMRWLPVAGLDRHTPMIGLRVLRNSPAAGSSPGGRSGGRARVQEAIYRPISDFATACTAG
jgi:hypothetical protein